MVALADDQSVAFAIDDDGKMANTPAAATQIDGGLAQQVAGLGAYVFWQKTLYGEVSFYRTADGAGEAAGLSLPQSLEAWAKRRDPSGRGDARCLLGGVPKVRGVRSVSRCGSGVLVG